MTERGGKPFLLCRVVGRRCALPVEHVIETMRPIAVEPLAGVPPFVLGVALIRGIPTPVADLAKLLAHAESHPTRYVTIRTSMRPVALAVDAVDGVRAVPAVMGEQLPPLLREAAAEAIEQLTMLDGDLFTVLNTARLIPDTVWSALDLREIAE